MDSLTRFTDQRLYWLNDPTSWVSVEDSAEDVEGSGGSYNISDDGGTLKLFAPTKKDFWSKTFYSPILIKSDASALVSSVPVEQEVTVKVDFEFSPINQFDQGGLLVFIDDNHWMKCGIEYCDGRSRLSVVVCNEYSDWSTQPWSETSVSLKIHKVSQSHSLVVEAATKGSNDYSFIRIAHLSPGPKHSRALLPWQVGPYAACPLKQSGCQAVFTKFSLGPREPSTHCADL